MATESEEERMFWQDDGPHQDPIWDQLNIDKAKTAFKRLKKQRVEKSTDTQDLRTIKEKTPRTLPPRSGESVTKSAPQRARASRARPIPVPPRSKEGTDVYTTAPDSDEDRHEVENMIDTDTESSAPSTREPSFSFSNVPELCSRTTSMTSMSSASSFMPTPTSVKKRTFEYSNHMQDPVSPTSPTHQGKSRKKTRPSDTPSVSASSATRSSTTTIHSPQPLQFPPAVRLPDAFSPNRVSPSPAKSAAASVVSKASPRVELSNPTRRSEAMHPQSTGSTARAASDVTARAEFLRPRPTASAQGSPGVAVPVVRPPEQEPSVPQHSLAGAGPVTRAMSRNVVVSSLSTAPAGGDVVIIAHSREVQALMDAKQLAWGVQYEIARGVCHGEWTWADVTESKLARLRGQNKVAAPLVRSVMTERNIDRVPMTDVPLWTELDREHDAWLDNRFRGLGLQGEWQGDDKWYGGRIQQIARLVKMEKGADVPYKIFLEKMLKRKSNRFARFLGSRRMLQVSVPQELARDPEVAQVRSFLSQRFVVCGRVFVPFAAKERKVFMMEVNENFERSSDKLGDQHRTSLEAFVQWHNPLALNSKQPTSKWITRFDLGLSTSVPVLRFRGVEVDVFYIDDEVAPFDPSLRKAPTENIFTDGCGFMNGAALTLIGKHLGYSERPTVVQGRFAGSKGLWALHPEDQRPDVPPKIWIRDSQRKIKYRDDELGPAQLIFDLVAPPRITVPSRLSKYAIMNLSHNGVPDEVFVSLMEDGLRKEVEALTTWDGPQDMILLWNAVNQVGHVTLSKLRRQASGGGRVLGFGRAQDRDDSDEWGDDDDEAPEDSNDTGSLEYDGEPQSAQGAVMELLQAGFHPLKLPTLYDKLRFVVAERIEEFIKEYKIVVPRSAEAFIIPDPFGVLEEGQIHFKSSQNLKDPLEDASPTIITGEVLIYRNPTRVPSDVQKVNAVNHPALAEYVNVIVLPIKGSRSFANLLAGGDVDGDICTCIYEPLLVNNFRNPRTNDPPPRFQEENFEAEGSIEIVSDLNNRLQGLSPGIKQLELQKVLLSGLSDTPVGLYSTFHENTAYAFGYDDPRTLRNAFMFTTVLDSRKTGLKVQGQVFKADKRQFDRDRPLCMRPKDASQFSSPFGKTKLVRKVQQPFVLEMLLKAGGDIQVELLAKYDKLGRGVDKNLDLDLLRPFDKANNLAIQTQARGFKGIATEIGQVQEHIKEHLNSWRSLCKTPKSPAKASSSKSRTEAQPKPNKENAFKDLAVAFSRGPKDIPLLLDVPQSLAAIMASYAYRENPKFAFSVGFRSLCKVKADAVGSVAFSRPFAEVMTVPSAAVRVLSQGV